MSDWIPYDTTLPHKPKIVLISRQLNISNDAACGMMMRFWAWCGRVMVRGKIDGADLKMIDDELGIPGAGNAIASNGWCVTEGDGIRIPNHDRFLSNSFRARSLNAERQARYRSKKRNARVTPDRNAPCNARVTHGARYESVTTGQDRTGQENNTKPPLPPLRGERLATKKTSEPATIPDVLRTPDFEAEWARWLEYRRGRKLSVNPVSYAVHALEGLSEIGAERAAAALKNSRVMGYQAWVEPRTNGHVPVPSTPKPSWEPPPGWRGKNADGTWEDA